MPLSQGAPRTGLNEGNVLAQTGVESDRSAGMYPFHCGRLKAELLDKPTPVSWVTPNRDRPPRQQLTGHLPAGSITVQTSQSSAGSPAGGPCMQSPSPAAALGAPGLWEQVALAPAPMGNFMAAAFNL
ncbi:unnamed protein product [Rangifer tarandus platyrhynchus]|uniref:Uncharacterized protein n=2 Tax=Rangifer tarandus platyrhynchus TaxID=3082113 RepID=A0ACB0EHX8_RANTA|nr:unnamed protein product [Rangifer tarandus platyrhynchus]CAI9700235.1 unnamed protein product [Rangifer tarandus platyrhynchus]